MLLASSIFFLGLIVTMYYGQLLYFQLHLRAYRSEINYNEARILRNIAQTNHLDKNGKIITNKGEVIINKHDQYEITLKSGKKYILNKLS